MAFETGRCEDDDAANDFSEAIDWEPISMDVLQELGRRIDIEYVFADDEADMYGQLFEKYPHEQWTTLRGPTRDPKSGRIVFIVVRPRT